MLLLPCTYEVWVLWTLDRPNLKHAMSTAPTFMRSMRGRGLASASLSCITALGRLACMQQSVTAEFGQSLVTSLLGHFLPDRRYSLKSYARLCMWLRTVKYQPDITSKQKHSQCKPTCLMLCLHSCPTEDPPYFAAATGCLRVRVSNAFFGWRCCHFLIPTWQSYFVLIPLDRL